MISPFFVINTNTALHLLIIALFFYLPGCSSETDDLSIQDKSKIIIDSLISKKHYINT